MKTVIKLDWVANDNLEYFNNPIEQSTNKKLAAPDIHNGHRLFCICIFI